MAGFEAVLSDAESPQAQAAEAGPGQSPEAVPARLRGDSQAAVRRPPDRGQQSGRRELPAGEAAATEVHPDGEGPGAAGAERAAAAAGDRPAPTEESSDEDPREEAVLAGSLVLALPEPPVVPTGVLVAPCPGDVGAEPVEARPTDTSEVRHSDGGEGLPPAPAAQALSTPIQVPADVQPAPTTTVAETLDIAPERAPAPIRRGWDSARATAEQASRTAAPPALEALESASESVESASEPVVSATDHSEATPAQAEVGAGVAQALDETPLPVTTARRVLAAARLARAVQATGRIETAVQQGQTQVGPAPVAPEANAAVPGAGEEATASLTPAAAAVLRSFGIQQARTGRQARTAGDATAAPLFEFTLGTDARAAASTVAAASGSASRSALPTFDRPAGRASGAADAFSRLGAGLSLASIPGTADVAVRQTAETQSPSAAVPPSDAPVAGQIVKAISMAWRDGVGEARIRLTPDHLGEVVVALKVERGQVVAQLQAETAAARTWIESHQQDLRQALADQGLELDSFVVTSDGERRGAQDEPGARQRRPAPRGRQGTDAPRFDVRA